MRFNHYKDYTNDFKLVKRIWKFILKNQQYSFDFLAVCKYLRWRPYVLNGTKNILRYDRVNEIEYCLKLLKSIKAINKFEVQKIGEDNFLFIYDQNNIESLESLISNSRYYPLEGWPQEISVEFLTRKNREFDIPFYNEILKDSIKPDYKETAYTFQYLVLSEWEDAYQKMKGKPVEITDVNQNKFLFLIDEGYEILDGDGTLTDFQNDRVVAFSGFSKSNSVKQERRNKRMREYRKRHFSDWADKATDTGHYIAHSIWQTGHEAEVDLEFNLFPQKREINQGHSEEGKKFRAMESFCATHPDTFLFVRPIYGDSSIRPFIVEYGILMPDLTLWIEQFDNV